MEFYLDDLLVQSYSLPAAATGRIGLLNPANGIADVQVWNATLRAPNCPNSELCPPATDRHLFFTGRAISDGL